MWYPICMEGYLQSVRLGHNVSGSLLYMWGDLCSDVLVTEGAPVTSDRMYKATVHVGQLNTIVLYLCQYMLINPAHSVSLHIYCSNRSAYFAIES